MTSKLFEVSASNPLYKVPQYRYPHTLTFLNNFTPEAEAQMIRAFELDKEVPHSVTFRTSMVEPEGEDMEAGGWGVYVKDMFAMGLDWAAHKLGLVTAELAEHCDFEPKDGLECIRDGGTANSFAPSETYDTSDTEVDPDAEEIAARYLAKAKMKDPQVEVVCGPGVEVTRSYGGTLYAKRVDTETPDNDDVPYPTLPASQTSWPINPPQNKATHQTQKSTSVSIAGLPKPLGSPSVTASTDTSTWMASHTARQPEDTVFHLGSAGVNPLGAHARQVFASRKAPCVGKKARKYKIVSGSFGSFEVRKPNRFDERKYQLLPQVKEEMRKQ